MARVERSLAAGAEFDVWRPAEGWIGALAPLPGGPSEPVSIRDAGLAICEGADRLFGAGSGRTPKEVASLALTAPERLAELPGDFTFVAFGANETATAVRAAGGLVPIYYWRDDAQFALGTRLEYFVRFLPVAPALDPVVNAVWSTGWGLFPDGRTFLEGVSILDRGHYLRHGESRSGQIAPYWDPRPEVGQDPARDPERPQQLRRLLVETISRDLDAEGMNLLTLSGGVDSSALGALTVGTLEIPLAALTFLPPDPGTRRRDEHYVDALASRFPFDPHWRVLLDVETRIELLQSAPATCFQIIHPALGALPKLPSERPIDVLIGGEYADEVVGTMALLADWASHTSLTALVTGGPGSWPTGTYRDVARWAKRRLLHAVRRIQMPFPDELSEFVREEIKAEYSEWADRQRRLAAADRRPLRQLALSQRQDPFVVMNWEALSPFGVRRSLPFFNREMIELAFARHPSETLGPGTKKLLRSALAGDVPAENLQRQDEGTGPSPEGEAEWSRPLSDELRAIVRPDWFPRPPARLDQWDAWRLSALEQIVHGRRAAMCGQS